MPDFMSALAKNTEQLQPNVSVTENGAVGYKTTGKKLLDLNFMISSMRNMEPDEIWRRFLLAYNENPTLSFLWLMYCRDVRGGAGERNTFRVIFNRLCRENEAVALRLLRLIPVYGRWDDLVEVFCDDVPCEVRNKAFQIIQRQLVDDVDGSMAGHTVSLLAKWLPSLNTSSKETRRKAEHLRSSLGWTAKQYRVTLSRLRRYIDVTERKMSARDWSGIDYESVPSRAAMIYRDAFAKHDADRYNEYLTNVRDGKANIHAGTLYPHDIVHAYTSGWNSVNRYDETLEAQWNALPNTVPEGASTLVVVDGSGSMYSPVGGTRVTCLDVSYALGIYFAEKLSGPYKNKFITFSANPQYVSFADGLSLHARIDITRQYSDCSNTDLEKVFDMVLETAKAFELPQSEIPANILIVSDMEFDAATRRGGFGYNWDAESPVDESLFDTIRGRWEAAGYKLPRLIFWNVCSRTGTVPLRENELGVALVSGFSPSVADMVMSCELDPYKCLVDKLTGERYQPVIEALKE